MANKKLVQINTVCSASTGKIMGEIQRAADKAGYDTISFVGRGQVFRDMNCEKLGGFFSFWTHVILNTVFDRQGYASRFQTKRLVKRIREERPDIIHLHNLHGYYMNLPILFRYLNEEYKGKIFWTFHDCWPFTGHCPYFTAASCERWKTECHDCPNKTKYPVSLCFDASRINYRDKKKLFCGMKNLTIITPSDWLADLVKSSYLGSFSVKIVHNGIDLNKFSYRTDPEVLKRYKIPADKKILLGVANIWDQRKGLKDFYALAEALPERYQIVLVGLSARQIGLLPQKIIGIKRTKNTEELAALYSMSHIFINPSLEETFSLVTAEALACGTPVIVLDTSAVKELVSKGNGVVLHKHSVLEYKEAICEIERRNTGRAEIIAGAQNYSVEKMTENILRLYSESEKDRLGIVK